jgi:hypothetical protein
MATISLKRFTVNPNDGYLEFTFANSISGETGRRYANLAEVQAEVAQLDNTEDALIRYLLGYWLSRDDDLGNPNLVLNKNLTVDFSANNPIRLQ